MSKKTKIFALVILGIALLIGAGSFFGGSSTKKSTTTGSNPLSSSTAPAGVAGTTRTTTVVPNDFSVLLSSVKNIVIDTTIFTDPTYKSLRDYPVDLGFENIGRPNPFAPVGVDIGTISGTGPVAPQSLLDVQTLQPGKITPTTAEFGARVTMPEGTPVTLTFEYGPTDLFGNVTSPIAIAKTKTELFVITGLLPSTTYYVRAVVVGGSSTSMNGSTMLFTTTAKAR